MREVFGEAEVWMMMEKNPRLIEEGFAAFFSRPEWH